MVDVVALARERAREEPCVLATVVWRRAPSSGREGGKALIGADGGVQGWLGGACAEPAVVREAMVALAEGTPRLMFLGPADELERRRRDGMVSVPIACQSEGALEVYLEPMLPPPHVVAIGRSPAVDALARLAEAIGWRATVVDRDGGPSDHPGIADVRADLDLAAAGVGRSSYVVVATQGHHDEEALEAALATGAAYVGLVASRRRAEAVRGYLAQRGVAADDLARVRAPAGLDLGGVPPQEIAVAILAELVALRAAGELRPAAVAGAAAPGGDWPSRDGQLPHPSHGGADAALAEAVDPVCGMTVAVAGARYVLETADGPVHFCCAGCMATYETAGSGR